MLNQMIDDKPDTDLQERSVPFIGETRLLPFRNTYSLHAGHTVTCIEIIDLGGREYDVTWRCECVAEWTNALKASHV